MSVLPIALQLADKPVLVVGAGRIGAGKARLLVESGARVTIISRDVLAPLPDGIVSLVLREYRPGDLRGHLLVVSATGDAATNDRLVTDARDEGIWLNVVDDPGRSNFYFTAVHRAGDVVVSVSTSGASPALAQAIRSLVRDALPDDLDEIARQLRRERAALHESGQSTEGVDWRPRIRELLARGESNAPSSRRRPR